MTADTATTGTGTPEAHLAEYQQANDWWRQISQMRRQDLAAFTVIQGGVVTVIGQRLLALDAASLYLSIIAFAVTLIGLNNERRLYAYLDGVRSRAIAIEAQLGISLIRDARSRVEHTRVVVRSSVTFHLNYALVAIGWIIVWVRNA